MKTILVPELLLQAYSEGYFPMAESKDGEIYWHSPDPRAIIPFHSIKIPRKIRSKIRKENWTFRIDSAFDTVLRKCADREETWINEEIIQNYSELNYMGFAHSVETWKDREMVGGLYGVTIGGAFFGESMFNDVADSSKAAYYFLIEHLKAEAFALLDSQYINPHTELLGAIEIPRDEYMLLLKAAINLPCKFIEN